MSDTTESTDGLDMYDVDINGNPTTMQLNEADAKTYGAAAKKQGKQAKVVESSSTGDKPRGHTTASTKDVRG